MALMAQAAGGSATIALGTGVIADISLPHERGKFVGVFQFAGTFSTASESCTFYMAETDPVVGPVLGGVFAYTLGWRSIFWFLTIFCGVVLMPIIL
jgi:MFS family permease